MAEFPTGVEIHNGKIRISFNFRGKRCREILKGWTVNSSNLKKAGNLRALICSEIQLGTFNYQLRFPESKSLTKHFPTIGKITTFDELCSTYHSIKEIEVTSSTLKVTKSVNEIFKKIIGKNTLLSDIQHNDILLYRKRLLEGEYKARRPGKRTVRTVNSLIGQLCRMLKYAYHSNYISHVPFENIKVLKKSSVDPDPLLKEEFNKMIMCLSGQESNLWIFAVYSGLRHGELTGLAWEDVDLNSGEVRVKRTITLTKEFGPPKTTAGLRTVTLLQPALDALKRQFLLTGEKTVTEITFHHREYGKTEQQKLRFCFMPHYSKNGKSAHYSTGTIKHSWKRAIKEASIRYRTPYHSRHTFACWLLSSGANPSFIASQMGHENAQMVYTVYSKWISQMNHDQISMLNNQLRHDAPIVPLEEKMHSKPVLLTGS